MQKTACPLDCYDSCSIVVNDDLKLKGEKEHPVTGGFLCHHLNNYHKFERIKTARFHSKEISLEEALGVLCEKLKESEPKKTLLFKGSGNLAVMQSVTKLFFAPFGATLAKGSLCEDAGTFGIEEGRGADLALSPTQVAKSEVVIIWGRNPSVTNAHMLAALRGKKIIVIDPYRSDIAKRADLHIQLRPRGDIYLALALSRMAYMQGMDDEEFIENRCENFNYFVDFICEKPLRIQADLAGVNLAQMSEILEMIEGKKVSILVGIGVQKYSIGHSVLRAIDSFAALLGLFGKEGCGVGYVSQSSFGFDMPFGLQMPSVPLPTVDFAAFELVFIQGANPLSQMPCTPKVADGLSKAKFIVYFGLYENETSKIADLIIPAKNFLEKTDLKLSYGHEFIGDMPQISQSNIGISEYDLSVFLNQKFSLAPLKSANEYIQSIKNSNSTLKDGRLIASTLESVPYSEKFYTASGKFEFFDEFDDDFEPDDESFYMLHVKQNKSLNSQFATDDLLHVPVSLGLEDGQTITLSNGERTFSYTIKVDENLRDDCMLLYSGGKYSNMLTPYATSQEGDCAIFEELQCKIVTS